MKIAVNKTENSTKSSQTFFSKNNDSGFFIRQAKLKVGQVGDKYEQEADRVADQVIKGSSESQSFFAPDQSSKIQLNPLSESISPYIQKEEEEEAAQPKLEKLSIQKQEEEEEAQTKLEVQRQEEEEEEMLQAKEKRSALQTQESTEQLLRNSKGNGNPLNKEVQTEMKNSFGADFSNVKIHTDSNAVQMNKELGAQAFTSGNDIYFNTGKYKPETQDGKKLLAHELTHTIQQGASHSSTEFSMINRAISTPVTPYVKNPDTSKKVSFKLSKINIVVKPDGRSDKKELENKAKTTFKVSNNGTPGYSFEGDKITKVDAVPVPTITVQTIYGKNTTASSTSAYGKGTTADDKKAGNTTLGFHEGSHGTDYLNYIKNNSLPQFKGVVGMTVAEYKKAVAEYQKAWTDYSAKMDQKSELLTDCVGTKASFCKATP